MPRPMTSAPDFLNPQCLAEMEAQGNAERDGWADPGHCGACNPEIPGWRCNRTLGHEGVHVGVNLTGNRVRWPWVPR